MAPFASGQTYTLDQVLAKMNDVNKTFRSLEASVERTDYTALLSKVTQKQSGKVKFKRPKTGESRVRFDFTMPEEILTISDGVFQDYNPRTKQALQHHLDNKDSAEFLMVGFAASNEELKKSYDVSLIGDDTVDGQKTSVIELKPKSPEVAKNFKTIRLWLDQKLWVPIQTKLSAPNGDTLTAKFTDIKLNRDISDSAFKLNLPKDTQIIH
jgi:outer membrane lipoprotein-sorting protein